MSSARISVQGSGLVEFSAPLGGSFATLDINTATTRSAPVTSSTPQLGTLAHPAARYRLGRTRMPAPAPPGGRFYGNGAADAATGWSVRRRRDTLRFCRHRPRGQETTMLAVGGQPWWWPTAQMRGEAHCEWVLSLLAVSVAFGA